MGSEGLGAGGVLFITEREKFEPLSGKNRSTKSLSRWKRLRHGQRHDKRQRQLEPSSLLLFRSPLPPVHTFFLIAASGPPWPCS